MVALDAGTAALATPRRKRGLGAVFWLAVGWILLVVVLALLADVLPLDDPARMSLGAGARRAPPSAAHWLGTDVFGRDILARLLYGTRSSLLVGLCAPLLGMLVGGLLGLLAGYFRGRFELLVIGGTDVLLAFPPLVLALAMVTALGPSIVNLVLVLGLLSVPAVARVARVATLVVRERDFVTAARALGASDARILRREILPNVILPLGAFFLVLVAVVIVAEGILSFLGLGVPAPAPSWGGMIAAGRDSLDVAPHVAFIPSAVMFLTVLSFNLVGDVLRAATDPRRGAP